jgi:photosystem II stability/assembly factor-like uncharacterized protein
MDKVKFSRMMVFASVALIGLSCVQASGSEWTSFPLHPRSSFRGIYPLDKNTVWVCGSEGVVIRYSRRDEQVVLGHIQGLEHSEFRSIHAWDEQNAIVATAGQPACLYRTADGGLTWREVYRSSHPTSFFNGMKFLGPEKGIVFGDPVDGRMEVLVTLDAGKNWTRLPAEASPLLQQGEAGFAASNSSMLLSEDWIWVGLGGNEGGNACVLQTPWKDLFNAKTPPSWKRTEVRSISRSPSRGIFSLCRSTDKLIAVGGDYKQLFDRQGTLGISDDRGNSWRQGKGTGVRGFRSSIVFHPECSRWICTGPTGTDISRDGETWAPFSELGFHTLGIAKDGSVWAAGADGAVGQVDAPKLLQALPN